MNVHMTMMTKEEARLFKERWKVVNEFTDAEQRRKSASENVRELGDAVIQDAAARNHTFLEILKNDIRRAKANG
ncbi:MAG: hypothetical protein ACRD2L_19335 [Terriglobia bacterium]